MQHSRWPSPYSSVTCKKCASPSTPPKFNIAPENDGWKMSFLLGLPIFRFHVELRGVMDHCSLWICQKKIPSLTASWSRWTMLADRESKNCTALAAGRLEVVIGWSDGCGGGGGEKGSNKVREKSRPQKNDTPWKTNTEPTNHLFRKENYLPNLHDYVPC